MAKPDSTVFVDCITNPTDDVNVKWLYQGKEVKNAGTGSDVYKMQNNTLIITKIKRRNSGTYSCTAKLGAESRVEEFKVEVMCK